MFIVSSQINYNLLAKAQNFAFFLFMLFCKMLIIYEELEIDPIILFLTPVFYDKGQPLLSGLAFS